MSVSPISRSSLQEIIETYWNVNESKIRQKAFFRIEIIETYWNVNYVLKMADLGQVMK